MCGCRDGRIECARAPHSNGSQEEDACDRCQELPPGPVCGPDGRNHLTRCSAVNCADFSPVELEGGPCQSQVCRLDHASDGVVAEYCIASTGQREDLVRARYLD